MALLGLPGLRYLQSEDREEKLLLLGVLEKAVRQYDVMQQNLAVRIANAWVKSQR